MTPNKENLLPAEILNKATLAFWNDPRFKSDPKADRHSFELGVEWLWRTLLSMGPEVDSHALMVRADIEYGSLPDFETKHHDQHSTQTLWCKGFCDGYREALKLAVAHYAAKIEEERRQKIQFKIWYDQAITDAKNFAAQGQRLEAENITIRQKVTELEEKLSGNICAYCWVSMEDETTEEKVRTTLAEQDKTIQEMTGELDDASREIAELKADNKKRIEENDRYYFAQDEKVRKAQTEIESLKAEVKALRTAISYEHGKPTYRSCLANADEIAASRTSAGVGGEKYMLPWTCPVCSNGEEFCTCKNQPPQRSKGEGE